MNNTKETLLFFGYLLMAGVVILFTAYGFIAVISWIATDPLNIIAPINETNKP